MESIKTKCNNCGGNMAFDGDKEGLVCENCGTVDKVEMIEMVHKHDYYQGGGIEDYEDEEPIEVDCEVCGAKLTIEAHKSSDKCPYCNSTVVLDNGDKQVDGLVPFVISPVEAKASYKKWMEKRWFAPGSLKKLYQHDQIRGSYLPAWSFDGYGRGDYTAMGGHNHTETYTDDDGNSKTKTVTEWQYTSGFESDDFRNILVRGTMAIKDGLKDILDSFSDNTVYQYKKEYLAGYTSEKPTIDRIDAYEDAESIMKGKIEESIKGTLRRDFDVYKNLDIAYSFSDIEFASLLIPVYITSYMYKNKTYDVIINAENGKVTGEAPISVVKILLIVLGVLAVLFLVYYFTRR